MTTISAPHDVTDLLHEWRQGDHQALDKLTALVYDELRRIAHRYLRHERDYHTLQTTALINEAYLRLMGQQHAGWQNRQHFFAVTAQIMRHVLIDYARRRHYAKRGGKEAQRVSLGDETIMSHTRARELIELDEALKDLARLDERKSQVVELRYFGGLSIEETADVLNISPMTVRRDWQIAKAWLYVQVENRESKIESKDRNST